jgi:hypothetical protein
MRNQRFTLASFCGVFVLCHVHGCVHIVEADATFIIMDGHTNVCPSIVGTWRRTSYVGARYKYVLMNLSLAYFFGYDI